MRNTYVLVNVCIRNVLSGVPPNRALSVLAAGTVVDGKLERGKGAGAGKRGVDGQVRPFEEIPHTGRNGWVNLVKFWREDRFRHLHMHTQRTFNALGPIYR